MWITYPQVFIAEIYPVVLCWYYQIIYQTIMNIENRPGDWQHFCDHDHTQPHRYINLQDVLYWISDNADDEDAMTKVNRASYVFTGRYKRNTYGD